jgi:hypothetical protein
MPVEETFLTGADYVIILDGFTAAIEGGSFWSNRGRDTMTNSKSQGFRVTVGTTREGGLSGIRAVYERTAAPPFKSGDIVTCDVHGPEILPATVPKTYEGPRWEGNVRIGRMEYPVLTVEGGIRYNFDADSEGPFTVTHGEIEEPAP